MQLKDLKSVSEGFEVHDVVSDVVFTSVDNIALRDINKVESFCGRKTDFYGRERVRPYGVRIEIYTHAVYHYQSYEYVFWFKTKKKQRKCLDWFHENCCSLVQNKDEEAA